MPGTEEQPHAIHSADTEGLLFTSRSTHNKAEQTWALPTWSCGALTPLLPPAGLSPAWFLQHVIVRDLQTARSTFFLVNDWLSVETEANGGLVEKEVLAASKACVLSPPETGGGASTSGLLKPLLCPFCR